MARCLDDPAPDREHSLPSMLRQRVFGILAGYEDCNLLLHAADCTR
jgi:hypothetical protein